VREPASTRLFEDPLAAHFAGADGAAFSEGIRNNAATGPGEPSWPEWHRNWVAVRTAEIDAQCAAALDGAAGDITQVVNLGAGLDSRAFRALGTPGCDHADGKSPDRPHRSFASCNVYEIDFADVLKARGICMLTRREMESAGTRGSRVSSPLAMRLCEITALPTLPRRRPSPAAFHPLEAKSLTAAARGIAPLAERYVSVAADITDARAWSGALCAAGFDPARPALFLGEGLLCYLAPRAARAALGAAAALAAPGSVWVGDWHTPESSFSAALGPTRAAVAACFAREGWGGDGGDGSGAASVRRFGEDEALRRGRFPDHLAPFPGLGIVCATRSTRPPSSVASNSNGGCLLA
jgi:hypothetical protein